MLSRYARPLSLMLLLLSRCAAPEDEDQAPGTELRIFQREMQCGDDGDSTAFVGGGAVMLQAFWCNLDDECTPTQPNAFIQGEIARKGGCSNDSGRLIVRYIRAVDVDARQPAAARVSPGRRVAGQE